MAGGKPLFNSPKKSARVATGAFFTLLRQTSTIAEASALVPIARIRVFWLVASGQVPVIEMLASIRAYPLDTHTHYI